MLRDNVGLASLTGLGNAEEADKVAGVGVEELSMLSVSSFIFAVQSTVEFAQTYLALVR
jgi:hypothetical protein